MNTINLKIKSKDFDLIKSGVKKNEWRNLSAYNRKKLLVKNAEGKQEGNQEIKYVIFENGYSADCRKIKIEVKSVKVFRFGRDIEIPEENFRASEGQFAIQLALGNIVNN